MMLLYIDIGKRLQESCMNRA